MDYLWTPWRYRYVAEAGKQEGCIFCEALAINDDERSLILLRQKKNFVILNRFPYTTGHAMIVPYAHLAELSAYDGETLGEMMELAKRLERALTACYRPQGFNLGMNLGRSAGAGVAGHVHLHVVPRWAGDTNFMTTVGETRMEPEDLATTFRKLRPALAQAG